jgi:hypothetical protein
MRELITDIWYAKRHDSWRKCFRWEAVFLFLFFRFEIPWHHWCGAFVKYLRDMSDVDVKIRRDNIMRNIELLYTHLLLWKYTLCLPMVFTHAVSILKYYVVPRSQACEAISRPHEL